MKNESKSPLKTRVLYIGPVPSEVGGQGSGGVATLCWGMATQAYKNGYEVYLYTNVTSSYNKDGVRLICRPSGSKLEKAIYVSLSYVKNKKIIKNLDFMTWREKVNVLYQAYLFKDILKSVKPDIVHILRMLEDATFGLSAINNYPPIVITDNGIGLVYECGFQKLYGIARKDILLKRIEQVLKITNCIISVSQFERYLLLKALSLSSHQKIKKVLNPVDTDKWPLLNRDEAKRALGLDNKSTIFFCAVHFPVEIKGLDILLKAVAGDEYIQKNCNVLIITSEKAKLFAQDFVKANNIKRITILGPQPQEKLRTYYNAADAFVLPSRIEGIATVYYEALLAEVPLVGFARNIEELEEVLGIYVGEKFDVNKDDEKSLAEKIKKILNTDFDRHLLRQKVIDNLSWNVKFHEYDSIYQEILRNVRISRKST